MLLVAYKFISVRKPRELPPVDGTDVRVSKADNNHRSLRMIEYRDTLGMDNFSTLVYTRIQYDGRKRYKILAKNPKLK